MVIFRHIFKKGQFLGITKIQKLQTQTKYYLFQTEIIHIYTYLYGLFFEFSEQKCLWMIIKTMIKGQERGLHTDSPGKGINQIRR